MFKPLFGKLFDLDGDGKVTFEEELIGLHIMDEMKSVHQKDDSFTDTGSFDGDDDFCIDEFDDDF